MAQPTIIFEDRDILVLNKPAGITVNSSDTTHAEATLQDWLGEHYGSYYSFKPGTEEQSDFYSRNGIVHRLDKETSGIIVVAKTLTAFNELQRQFKERSVKKTYIALAHGEIIPPDGEVNVPVGRLVFNRKRFGVVAGGRESRTLYNVIDVKNWVRGKNKEKLSLVRLYPQTGRTHQIRVHLKYLNHPIVSDELYAGRKTAREDRKYLSRLFLHASGISFIHPNTDESMTFENPLPTELQVFLATLR